VLVFLGLDSECYSGGTSGASGHDGACRGGPTYGPDGLDRLTKDVPGMLKPDVRLSSSLEGVGNEPRRVVLKPKHDAVKPKSCRLEVLEEVLNPLLGE
jgi:hypothetical protein